MSLDVDRPWHEQAEEHRRAVAATNARTSPPADRARQLDDAAMLKGTVLNRIQIAIARGDTLEEWVAGRGFSEQEANAVAEYWTNLAAEMSQPLPPGQYWDVISD